MSRRPDKASLDEFLAECDQHSSTRDSFRSLYGFDWKRTLVRRLVYVGRTEIHTTVSPEEHRMWSLVYVLGKGKEEKVFFLCTADYVPYMCDSVEYAISSFIEDKWEEEGIYDADE